MTRAQSAAKLSLDVMPGARLLIRLSTRCPRVVWASDRSNADEEEVCTGGTSTGPVEVVGVDRATTEDDGGGTAASSSRGASAEGSATGSLVLDGGVFWQEELAFI